MHNPPRTMDCSDEAVRRAQTGDAESTPGDAVDPKPTDAPPDAAKPDAT